MDPFLFLARWFWIPAILVSVLNYVIMYTRTKKLAQGNVERQAGYAKILRVYYAGSTIPFVVMGAGIVFGGVPTLFHFFRPQDGNPFVLAWFATVLILSLLSCYWVFFRGGAQTLATYPGAVTKFESPLLIKLMVLISFVGTIVGIIMMYRIDFPVDDFFGL